MKKRSLLFLLQVIKIFVNHLPWLMNALLAIVKWTLKYVFKYRSKTIKTNLQNSLSHRFNGNEIQRFYHQYYDILLRYIKESLYILSWPKERICSKVAIKDVEKWRVFFDHQSSTIVTASHYGNWEMNIVLFPSLIGRRVIAFYKPISDKTVDDLMKQIRSPYGLELYPIEQTARIMTQYKGENILYIFIGDQTPVNLNGVHWNQFLQQATPWLTGAEKLAKKYNYAVVYLHQTPSTDASKYYQLSLEVITIHPKETKEGVITQCYSDILEREILESPVYWLWSHKRWKRAHQRPLMT